MPGSPGTEGRHAAGVQWPMMSDNNMRAVQSLASSSAMPLGHSASVLSSVISLSPALGRPTWYNLSAHRFPCGQFCFSPPVQGTRVLLACHGEDRTWFLCSQVSRPSLYFPTCRLFIFSVYLCSRFRLSVYIFSLSLVTTLPSVRLLFSLSLVTTLSCFHCVQSRFSRRRNGRREQRCRHQRR